MTLEHQQSDTPSDQTVGDVVWSLPPMRRGLAGAWDSFAGPGWTGSENLLLLAVALAGAASVPLWAAHNNLGWNAMHYTVAALLGFDIIGGAVALAASPCKRWHHPPGARPRLQEAFALIHLHPFLVAWFYSPEMGITEWSYAIQGYGYLAASTFLLLQTPLYLKRPVCAALLCGGFLLNALALEPPYGFEWFLPAYYFKLLGGHLTPEAPFRPRR